MSLVICYRMSDGDTAYVQYVTIMYFQQSMMDGVAAAITETGIVTEIVTTITVVVVFLDVDGHVFLHVHRVRDRVGHGDLDRHFHRVRDGPVDVHRDVFFDVHGVRHVFLNGHRIRHVFLDRYDDWPVHDDGHLLGDVDGRADVPVTVFGTQQTVVGQAVPLTVATVSIAQTPQASFALFLLCWLLGRLLDFATDQGQADADQH